MQWWNREGRKEPRYSCSLCGLWNFSTRRTAVPCNQSTVDRTAVQLDAESTPTRATTNHHKKSKNDGILTMIVFVQYPGTLPSQCDRRTRQCACSATLVCLAKSDGFTFKRGFDNWEFFFSHTLSCVGWQTSTRRDKHMGDRVGYTNDFTANLSYVWRE